MGSQSGRIDQKPFSLSPALFAFLPPPKNTPSFLLSHSMRQIDRQKWPILIMFADEWQGHVGTIYKASGWIECGFTSAEPTYTLNGVMISRKAGPVTRTHDQMIGMGCEMVGRFRRRRFVHARRDLIGRFKELHPEFFS